MKYFAFFLWFGFVCHLGAGEITVLPPRPDLTTLTALTKVFNVILILKIDKTITPASYKLQEIVHGEAEYKSFKVAIDLDLPKPRDVQSVLPDYEVVFVAVDGAPTAVRGRSSFPVYPAHTITDGINKFHIQAHSLEAVKAAIADGLRQTNKMRLCNPHQPPLRNDLP